jgi:hypothetical protein
MGEGVAVLESSESDVIVLKVLVASTGEDGGVLNSSTASPGTISCIVQCHAIIIIIDFNTILS